MLSHRVCAFAQNLASKKFMSCLHMPSLTDGEVVQNFQSRALKLSRELDCVRRELSERERELSAAEKVETQALS
jgi:hypothetical protein